MIPNQFQYRDLINHTLSGCLFIMTLGVFVGDINPTRSRELLTFLNTHLTRFGGVVVVPLVVGFILSYVVGSMLSTAHTYFRISAFGLSYKGNNKIDRIQTAIIRIFYKILAIKRETDNRITPLVNNSGNNSFVNLLRKKIKEVWDIDLAEIKDENELKAIFDLCRSYVESQPTSLSNIDIERHFAHQLFGSRLAMLFLICFYLSISEAIISCFTCLTTYTKLNGWFWLLIALFFWLQARNSIIRTIGNSSHWARLIYYAFINSKPEKDEEKHTEQNEQ